MNDEERIDLSTLALDEIEELLEDMGVELEPAPLRELATFMQQVGDLDEALDALAEIEKKAA